MILLLHFIYYPRGIAVTIFIIMRAGKNCFENKDKLHEIQHSDPDDRPTTTKRAKL